MKILSVDEPNVYDLRITEEKNNTQQCLENTEVRWNFGSKFAINWKHTQTKREKQMNLIKFICFSLSSLLGKPLVPAIVSLILSNEFSNEISVFQT